MEAMEPMDYQMENPSIPNAFDPMRRRCPYARGNAPSIFRNNYHNQNAYPFVPSGQYLNQPLNWTSPTTFPQLLPTPLPTLSHINNTSNRFAHFATEGPPRGPPDQSLQQHLMMSGNVGGEADGSWLSSPAFGIENTNQSEGTEADRSRSTSSDSSTAGVFGSTYNAGSPARSNQHILPPFLHSPGRSAPSTLLTSANASSESNAQAMGSRRDQELRNLSTRDAPNANMRPNQISSDTLASSTTRFGAVRRERSEPTITGAARPASSFGDDLPFASYMEYHVPPSQSEGTMRVMDDHSRMVHARLEQNRLLAIMARGQLPPRNPGASRAAIDSLIKVDIAELKEDDRTCQICYNDYGVENPDGVTEQPIRMPKCKHTFGAVCLKKWFENKSTCPYCRDQLPSDAHRARRPHTESRRARTEISRDDATHDAARIEAARIHYQRQVVLERSSISVAAHQLNSLRASAQPVEQQHQENLSEIAARQSRSELYSSSSNPRRIRGRAASGLSVHQGDFGGIPTSMRTPTSTDSQHMPMRVPVAFTSESYGHGHLISPFGRDARVRHNHPGYSSPGPGFIPTGSSFSEAIPPEPQAFNFSPANNYPMPYALITAQQTENHRYSSSPPQDRDYRQLLPPSLNGQDLGANRPRYSNSSTARNMNISNVWDSPPFPMQPSLQSLRAVEEDGERRTLHPIRDSAGSSAQNTLTGHSAAERSTHDEQRMAYSDSFFNEIASRTHSSGERRTLHFMRDSGGSSPQNTLTMHSTAERLTNDDQRMAYTDSFNHMASLTHSPGSVEPRGDPRQPNLNPSSRGSFLDDRYPGSMPPPPPPNAATGFGHFHLHPERRENEYWGEENGDGEDRPQWQRM